MFGKSLVKVLGDLCDDALVDVVLVEERVDLGAVYHLAFGVYHIEEVLLHL
jgi:ribosomal protein L7Ae-like RNA K-turn-binding protein